MTTTLITGANKGLGYETARRLLADGHDVWVGARDAARGQAAADELGARFVQLDVTDDASVAAAAETVAAGTASTCSSTTPASPAGSCRCPRSRRDVVERVLATNVVGIVRVTQAFLPLLERSPNPVIVNVSSGMGSLGVTTDPERLESTLVGLAVPGLEGGGEHAHDAVREGAAGDARQRRRPGLHRDRLQRPPRPQTVEQGTDAIVRMAQLDASGPTGTYVDDQGTVPW